MKMGKRNSRRLGFFGALIAAALLSLAFAGSALAAPAWRLTSFSPTTIAPEGELTYRVQATSIGDTEMDGSEIDITADLPVGLTAENGVVKNLANSAEYPCTAGDGSSLPSLSDPTHVKCANNEMVAPFGVGSAAQFLYLTVKADPSPPATVKTSFEVSGGGAPLPATTVDPTIVSATEAGFGVDAFDGLVSDAAGQPFTQAGGHPDEISTSIAFDSVRNPLPIAGDPWPAEPLKDISVELPPGFIGNPRAADTCTAADLANGAGFQVKPLCPTTSQVGQALIGANTQGATPFEQGPVPVFNLVPPPNVPARFGFNFAGSVVVLDAKVRSGGDYGITVSSTNTSQGLAVLASKVNFWGVPASSAHDSERACPGFEAPQFSGEVCENGAPLRAFLRNPTSCTPPGAALETRLRTDSWTNPTEEKTASFVSHQLPGYPEPPSEWGAPVGIDGCAGVPFNPALKAAPSVPQPVSPSGLSFRLSMPQGSEPGQIGQADLKKAVVTLPAGMAVNPSSASGLGACSSAQIDLHGENTKPQCPDSSKIGTVEVKTPLLSDPLEGAVYLASPHDNPFDSLLALYIVAEGPGTVVKLAGRVDADPNTGQLRTTFDDNPQLPFEELHVELKGGPRAPLVTPAACGTYQVESTLTSWSGKTVALKSPFTVSGGCARGFDPKLDAGLVNPLAGTTSSFVLRLTREDTDQELSGLSATLPPGLSGYLKGIPYCPEAALAGVSGAEGSGAAQLASPSCPAASRIGTVTVGAGAGVNPFYVQSGKAYLAGPYKGAPLSLAVITPAVAGPFDLGNVLVRTALQIDPTTAQITAVSDPFPTILHGIPLDLRDVRVNIDRDHFTLNPTSCEPMQIGSTIASAQGATANPSVHFQTGGCERLGFKPRLGIKLRGDTGRGGNPALTAVFRPRAGDANTSRVQVALPHSEFLDQAHIGTICTRVQFAAEQCPAGSIYGHVTATSPIVDYKLSGPVYLRSSSHKLPDLVLKLRGPDSQPIEVDAVGRIDSINGGIRTTFAAVPDAPLSKVVLRMRGGKKSLLQNSRNLCAATYRAEAALDAHNGKAAGLRPALAAAGCHGKAHKRHR